MSTVYGSMKQERLIKLTEREDFKGDRKSLVTSPMRGQDCTDDIGTLRFYQLSGVLRKVIDKGFLTVGTHGCGGLGWNVGLVVGTESSKGSHVGLGRYFSYNCSLRDLIFS